MRSDKSLDSVSSSSGMHAGAGKFIFVAALPKSASSLMWLMVSALQEQNGRADPGRQRGRLPHPLLPLTWDLLDNFPEGGTFKSHAPAFATTSGFLRILACKYVVLLRHPADFIPALYCHIKGEFVGMPNSDPVGSLPAHTRKRVIDWMGCNPASEVGPEQWVETIAPVQRSIFAAGVPLEEALGCLIADGALLRAMQWMADWLRYRDEKRSIVITYEELMGDFNRTIERLATFVRGEAPTDDILTYLDHVTREVAREGLAKDPEKYPRGWTGEVGIWRQYFSENNMLSYDKVVGGFLSHYPNATRLASIYPDLLIRPSS